jgi:hypothetical protein
MEILNSPLVKLALTVGAAYAVYKFAPSNVARGAALGVIGVIALNQIPVVRDGANVRLVA